MTPIARTHRERRRSKPPTRRTARNLVCGGALALTACAGTHFDGTSFEKRDTSYRIGALPAAWQRVSVEEADLAFHRPEQGTISVNATCREYDDVPAAALVNHLLFGTTHRQYILEEEVTLDGRNVRHVIVDCELDGVPVRAEAYLITRNGCVFDLDYISARSAPAHELFTRFVADFHITRAGHE